MVKKQINKQTTPIPCPAVIISVGDWKNSNLITLAWVGRVVSDPPVLSISIRPSRYSYPIIEKLGEFVVNIPTDEQLYEMDYCGTRTGKKVNKWEELKLTKEKASKLSVPLIKECPINIECKVIDKKEIGSHMIYFGEVLEVHVDELYLEKKALKGDKINPIVYIASKYYGLKEKSIGFHGYSMKNKK